MKKKKNKLGVQESLDFIIAKMVTKEEVREIVDEAFEGKMNAFATKEDMVRMEARLEAKIERIDNKLGGFENSEVDKRKRLEVRVTKLEQSVR